MRLDPDHFDPGKLDPGDFGPGGFGPGGFGPGAGSGDYAGAAGHDASGAYWAGYMAALEEVAEIYDEEDEQ